MLVVLFGVIVLTVGNHHSWVFFQSHGPRITTVVSHMRRELGAAMAVGSVACFLLGWLCTREAAAHRVSCALDQLARLRVALAALAIVAVVAIVWSTLDFGVSDISGDPALAPSRALQKLLAFAGIPAVFVVLGSLALRRRRAEQRRIGR
jgi:hypothetical protein